MKRIVLIVVSAALAATLAHRLYVQLWPVPLYLGSVEPLPPELAEELRELQVEPVMTRERPYEPGGKYPLGYADLLPVRARLAWGSMLPVPIDHITVFSRDRVVAHVQSSSKWIEVEYKRTSDGWRPRP